MHSSLVGRKIWFTSDTHYWHKAIIGYCNRPYHSVEEMNTGMIQKWNARVSPDDEVWHLGDFAFCGIPKAAEIIEQLNGHKHLVVGNHDSGRKLGPLFETAQDYKLLKIHMHCQNDEGEINQYHQPVVLSHFPFLSWDLMRHGSWHLHGHCHGTLPETAALRMDVGVDTHGMYPWSVDEILTKFVMRTVFPVDMGVVDTLHARR